MRSVYHHSIIFLFSVALFLLPHESIAQNHTFSDSISTLLHVADSALKRGNRVRAALAYNRVLEVSPENSRAVFQLAQLMPPGSRPAIRLYTLYVSLEPSDPWGYLALGDELASTGRLKSALKYYKQAMDLAPNERDVWSGLARILREMGKPDAVIATIERWTSDYPYEVRLWRALGNTRTRAGRLKEAISAYHKAQAIQKDERTGIRLQYTKARAAPIAMPYFGGSQDSDGNLIYRGAIHGEWIPFNRLRTGLRGDWANIEYASLRAQSHEFSFTSDWRPRSSIRVNTRIGLAQTRMVNVQNTSSSDLTPVLHLRARWQPNGRGLRGNVRLKHAPMLSSPLLILQQVVLQELRWSFSAPIYRLLRVRSLGRLGRLVSNIDKNHRIGYGGALAFNFMPGFEVSAKYQGLTYSHTTQSAYFAPKKVHTIEMTSYIEPAGLWPVTVALELGAGAQRVETHDGRLYAWGRALRLWGYLAWQFQPGRQLSLEIEAYDSASPGEALTSSLAWRYGSAMLSLRWGF